MEKLGFGRQIAEELAGLVRLEVAGQTTGNVLECLEVRRRVIDHRRHVCALGLWTEVGTKAFGTHGPHVWVVECPSVDT